MEINNLYTLKFVGLLNELITRNTNYIALEVLPWIKFVDDTFESYNCKKSGSKP